MRIYCDMDDILCETAASLCGLADRLFGVKVDYESVGEFNLQNVFKLSDAQMRKFSLASHAYETLMSYPETPGAIEGLKALRKAGHEVDIVTGRPASAWKGTYDWLESHGLSGCEVTFVDKYARGYGAFSDLPRMVPLAEVRARSYDVAIDDSPLSLDFLKTWNETTVLVFDRPWNRAAALAPNMTRVKDWRELIFHFNLKK